VSEGRRLTRLEEADSKLKRLVADLTLDRTMLHDALRKTREARQSPQRLTPLPRVQRRESGHANRAVRGDVDDHKKAR
jgi:hypothetical protein